MAVQLPLRVLETVSCPSSSSVPLPELAAHLAAALERCQGRVAEAAELLGLNRTYLPELITRNDLRS